jgi:hypothetical protein
MIFNLHLISPSRKRGLKILSYFTGKVKGDKDLSI